MACPVMALACSEQRNSAARAISSAVCPRPCRSVLRNPSNCSLGLTPSFLASTAPSSFDIVVSVTGPGQSAFTRTPFRPASAAVTPVTPSIPAFAAAYAEPHANADFADRSEEHTSELQSHLNLVCRLLLEKKKKHRHRSTTTTD